MRPSSKIELGMAVKRVFLVFLWATVTNILSTENSHPLNTTQFGDKRLPHGPLGC